MRASKGSVPLELRRKISPTMLMFSGPGIVIKIMCIAVAAFVLYLASHHNGFLYLTGALLCPSAVAVLYKIVPLRPYRGVFYDRTMHDIDRNDPVVMRLVQLLRSEEATRHIWGDALKLAGILFAIVWGAALLSGRRLSWSFSFPSSRFWGLMLLCFAGCFAVMSADHSEWGVMTWASRETGRHPADE